MKTNEEIKASGVYDIKEIVPGMYAGYMKLPECKRSSVVWSRGDAGMEHVSVAPLNKFKAPNWLEMCLVKDTFFYAEEEAYEIHPKHSQYVNKLDNCLHIWRPKNGLTIDALSELG